MLAAGGFILLALAVVLAALADWARAMGKIEAELNKNGGVK